MSVEQKPLPGGQSWWGDYKKNKKILLVLVGWSPRQCHDLVWSNSCAIRGLRPWVCWVLWCWRWL